jgi:hypothetical protein
MIGAMRQGGHIGRATLASLLFLAACADPAAPPGIPASAETVGTAFVEITGEVGLDFAFDRAASGDYFMPDSMAAGAALLDFDGDGRLDVYIVNGRWADDSARHAAGANRLYRQQPDGQFVDVTETSGAGDVGYGMGVATGDVDNDGDLDLYVTNYGPDALYINDGDGTFTDATRESGLGDSRWGASAGFVDYDGDGFLDLFVTTYLDLDPALRVSDSAGRPEYPGPRCCNGTPDILYKNNGDGTFTDASEESGIGALRGKGLGVVFADLDGDGKVDIYVANDGESNRAWIQSEDGTFTDRGQSMGLSLNIHGGAEAGMGIAIGDLHGNGRLDLLVTHLSAETNTLYRATGSGSFTDATLGSGLGANSVDFTGFGVVLLDFDLDGDLDPLVANGRVLRGPPRPGTALDTHWAPYAEENLLFENDGSGRFHLAAEACGTLCSRTEVSRGLAVGDIDNDGDLDVLLTNGNGSVRLYRNVIQHEAHWIAIRAVGATGSDTLGAQIHVTAGDRELRRDIAPAYGYLSSGDPRAYFGLGPANRVDEVRVVWPDGTEERFGSLEVDRIHQLTRGAGR